MENTFSVIVPTLGRDTLRTTVQSLLAQTLPLDRYEVVLVDDCSGSSYDWLPPNVRLITLQRRSGSAKARNVGIEHAKGSLIAFTDDDCVVPPNWLESLQEGLESFPHAQGVGGYLRPNDLALSRKAPARLELRQLFNAGADLTRLRVDPSSQSPAWGTNNVCWRKSALMDLGMFDPSVMVAHDSELARRAGEAGYCTVFVPLAVEHNRDYSWESFLHQQYARGHRRAKSVGRKQAARSLLRLIPAMWRAIRLLRSGDLSLCAASLARDIAFSLGHVSPIDNYRKG